jgi:hypothetical protein
MTKNESYEFLSEWFVYDTQSPSCLTWKKRPPHGRKGAGEHISYKNKGRYYSVRLFNYWYLCHRIILVLHGQEPEHGQVADHINRNSCDNRIENLRWTTLSQNNSNRKPMSRAGIKYARVAPNGRFRGFYRRLKTKRSVMCGTHDTAYAAHLAAITHKLENCWILPDD